MIGIESAIISTGKTSAAKLAKWGLLKIFEAKGTPFTNEIYDIINNTVNALNWTTTRFLLRRR